MYQEMIDKLKPLPKLNLKWYKNEDLYSEGDIEDKIIEIIAENEPEEYVQAIASCYCWSTFYHLTHIRKNILNWYTFEEDATVLEIGCGMGAITSVLCEKCKNVTAVELSKKRAMGTLLRCRKKENLEIIVGNLNDIEFEKKFDYITLVGVLEYQGSYTNTENPYVDFLKKVKTLLKPNGKLLIAIENQYGLKYWCGAREDHTGIPFEGINQYTISDKKVKTFSKKGLDELIKSSGYKNTYFYYPMPDYKLPTVIYSQDNMPNNSNMMNMQYYYIPNNATLVAEEKNIYEDIIKNDVFDFFANSFLVECTDSVIENRAVFASMSCHRSSEYQIGTRFLSNGKVEKFPLKGHTGDNHINQILQNEKNLRSQHIMVIENSLDRGSLTADFVNEKTLEEKLLELFRIKEEKAIYFLIDKVYGEICKSSEEAPWDKNIIYTFDLNVEPNKEKFGTILKTGYLDMIFRNAFLKDDQLLWFDQEWILENVPAKYILYRGLTQFYYSYPNAKEIIPLFILAERYGLLDCWNELQNLETLFIGAVMDQTHMAEFNGFCENSRNSCINNINKIIV